MLHRSVVCELLEERRFLSATVAAPAIVSASTSPALVVKHSILAPSAVEGTYKGTATDTDGAQLGFTLVITSTKATLTITGYGSGSATLSAASLKKLREGTFSYSGKVKSLTVKLSGKVTSAGKVISGSGTVSGKSTVKGTFLLKKK